MGVDINPEAVKNSAERLNFNVGTPLFAGIDEVQGESRVGDARDLSFIDDCSVDLALLHPPYADIIKYSDGRIKGDLSNIHSIDLFCDEIAKVASECWRVLKPGKFCAVLIGDTRRKKIYVPLAYKVMNRFLSMGFILREDVIKVQHNCRATGFWVKKSRLYNFLLIMHEHLFVFQKP